MSDTKQPIPAPSKPSTTSANSSHDPLLQFFSFAHLTDERMRKTSEMFSQVAHALVSSCPRNPERTVALRKLLEAKDCAVRSIIWKDVP